ncbi:dTMP kinase [Cohnella sp.]|uniref:dTMP kinase n=1 Tax=Cohnella sp. TaxID=1883426 RepID=UPI00356336F4
MQRGYFFSAEGGEGAGKSSIVSRLSEYLDSRGLEIITSREPGGIAIAEQIRSVILDKENTEMDGRTEALLYAAARRQHYVEKIVPTLNEGKSIICDRFIDSSLAYQGHARGLGIDKVLSINEFAIEDVFPDLTIYLDIDPEVGLRRINENADREINRLDLESLAFHRKVREGYLELVRRFPARIVKINANQKMDEVFEDVKQVFDRFLVSMGKLS